jgi:PAS domain S-box-containing protein
MGNQASESSRLVEVTRGIALHDHLCLVYETQEQQLSAAISFMQTGLERHEACLYVADANTTTTILDSMREQRIEVNAALNDGSLRVSYNREIYTKPGHFDPDWMLGSLGEIVRAVKAAGFSALRWAGEMTWVTGIDPSPERLLEYEAKLNLFLRDNDAVALCQYDRKRFSPEILVQVIRTHPIVVYGAYVCKNPYYVPPDEFLQPDQTEREIQRLLNNIQTYEAVQRALQESAAQARKHLAELDQIYNTAPVGLCLVDRNLRFARVNERLAAISGRPAVDHIGRTTREVLPDLADALEGLYARVFGKGESIRGVEIRRTTQAEPHVERDWEVSLYPLKADDGSVMSVNVVVEDITERKHTEDTLRQLSSELLRVQDEERRRIARDLHDSLAQKLFGATLNLRRVAEHARDRPARKLLSETRNMIEACAQEIRTLSYLLHPPLLDELGLAAALDDYAKGFSERTGIQVDSDIPADLGRLPQEVETALFRVIQESLTNVQRHSGSSTAQIRIKRDSHQITLEVRDQGGGTPAEILDRGPGSSLGLGVGISGMSERMRQLGGRLEIASGTSGTTVKAILPLRAT